jgi:hypothetical protein
MNIKILIAALFLGINPAQSQEKKFDPDKLMAPFRSYEAAKKMQSCLTESAVRAQVIETCSTPDLCGTMAFGSVSLVRIMDGKYRNTLVYLSTLCAETNYKIEGIYTIKLESAPDFSVILCNQLDYDHHWNDEIERRKHYMFFGRLE